MHALRRPLPALLCAFSLLLLFGAWRSGAPLGSLLAVLAAGGCLAHALGYSHRAAPLTSDTEHLLFEQSSLPMWIYSLEDLRFLAVNEAALRHYGYTREEFLSLDMLAIRPEAEREGMRERLARARLGDEATRVSRHCCRDGREILVEVHPHNVRHAGRPARLNLILDVSARESAEAALRESRRRWDETLEALGDGLWDWHVPSGRISHSQRWKAMLGYGVEELADRHDEWQKLVHPEDLPRVNEAYERHQRGEVPVFECEMRMRAKSGVWRWILGRGRIIERDDQGQPLRMVGTNSDITARKAGEDQLSLAARVFEHSHDAILIADSQWRTLSVNRAFTALSGYTSSEVVGCRPHFLVETHQPPEFFATVKSALQRRQFWAGEVINVHADGHELYVDESIIAVPDDRGGFSHYIIIASDISERREHQARIEFLAHYDALTGLPNRSLMQDRLGLALTQAERDGCQVGVLFFDLDRFKNINDSLGHHLGDRLLQAVAERVRGILREGDTVARQGGDEFVLILPRIQHGRDAAKVAAKLCRAMRAPVDLDGHQLLVTPSVGIALFPQDGRDVASLVKNADAAMYHAKAQGRDNYQFYTAELNARALESLSLENELRGAMAREELRLHFQPQFAMAGGRLTGAEALLRWSHPERGDIPPGLFIPIAEERGLIGALGEWTLREACRQIRAWAAAGMAVVPVAVNLSALQFRDRNLASRIAAVLHETGVAPEYLHLEITESVLMQHVEITLDTLRQLSALGLCLAIDDFGTGYSSLSYLHRFPLDKLKIDRSFVAELADSPDALALTETMIAMAKGLRLKVVAEGVETEAQRLRLGELGCDELQGYLVGRPEPAAVFAARLGLRDAFAEAI
ncbi:MAG: EAL domain-containing protein [Gammaproteobacteria bacterium]|nr:EAL domain-containing protein [Gammaproteobacteria bacterium]